MSRDIRLFTSVARCIVLTTGLASGQSFEVASLKVGTPPAQSTFGPLPGGERYRARNIPLPWLLSSAYGVPIRQILALPQAFAGEAYDIEAKAEHPVNGAQMNAMLRTLLEDRFKLVVRRETREMKAHILVLAKGGTKMEENRDGAELLVRKVNASRSTYRNVPMPVFSNLLAFSVDDTVVDQTGLKGSYDFTLNYMPERLGPGVLEGREAGPDPYAPSLDTALQVQLGLKLESRKVSVEVLVVEHIEKPLPN
jgi:uncharacterized protein (TIGR03435 family)